MRECPPPHPNPRKPVLTLPPGACDTHCHVFGPADRFPYAVERAYTPQDAPKQRLAQLHQRLGLSRTVFVQASCHGLDNSAMLDAIADDPERYRGIALLPTDTPTSHIAELHEQGIRGARFNFMARIGPMPILDEVTALAERIAPFGWHLVLHFDPDQLEPLVGWIRSMPIPIVIDHMGRMSASDYDTKPFKLLLALLESDRMWVKISGAERSSLAGPPFRDVIPIARALVAAAPERTLWGTDWPHPVLRGPMPDDGALVDLLAEFVPDERTRHRILVQNPETLYGFSPDRRHVAPST